MNKEDLFEGFGALEDDLLKRSEHGEKTMKKRRYLSGAMKYGSIAACIAACFVVVLGAGVLFPDHKTPAPDTIPESSIAAESNGNDEASALQEKQESFVDISMLLASNDGIEAQTLEFELVEIGTNSAHYYKVASVDSDILRESIGSEVKGTQNWYKVSGHEDMQYLISGNNNEYSLWKFGSFQKESYPYSDVLQNIYNIHSVEDITKIIVTPANMDNTDEGQAIQAEIGTSIVEDDKAIETIYNVLSGLTCYGKNNWDKIGLGSSMLNQVRAGRYLTIVTSQGLEIDTLKYTGISGMFYEYGGIAYSALTTEEKTVVEQILNIELIDEANEPKASSTIQDVPVDEETYQEARDYSAELTDLQNRISEAMMNKELPFVTSSAIYENPDRLHVTVNTKDEDLIAKLQAFDITGELLEIEYSESAAVSEK